MNPVFNSPEVSEEVFVFPASFAQQRLWFLHQLIPNNPFYNMAAGIQLSGDLNLTALNQTFNEIIQRHEVLRTTFTVVEKQLVQVISPSLDLPISVTDFQSISDSGQNATQWAIAIAQKPFNLTQDALLRVHLLQLQETEFILVLVLHHIIADGWSIGVLFHEFSSLYIAFSQGKPSPLPELPIQYADFSEWQRQWLQGEVLEKQLSYWRQQLQDLPVLNLPTTFPRSPIQRYRGATELITFSPDLTVALEALSQREKVSLFMTLLAVFQTLLYRYTGQTDIVVGSAIANRNRQELEGLLGFFVNSLVLRTNLSGNPSFQEVLARVRDVALGAYAHQDLPFEKLVQDLQPQRDLSRHPFFQVAIALQNTPINTLELPGLKLQQFAFETGTTRFDLEFHLWQSPEGLQGQITYDTDLFEASAIARMLGHFQTLLEAIVIQPDCKISELPLLTPAERQQLLIDWNKNSFDFPSNPSNIHQLFEAQAAVTPDAIALICQHHQLTYKELNQQSNQLAHHLKQQGVILESLVGICLERSHLAIIAILGILKAGAAYIPLDPTYPKKRLESILEDTQMRWIVTQKSFQPTFEDAAQNQELQVISIERDWDLIAQQSSENLASETTENNLAYVIYTSGSTGQPKGVAIAHRGILNLAYAQQQIFNLQPSDRILQFASLSFDASVFEIVMAFQAGATLYLAPSAQRSGIALHQFLRENAIATVTLPPAVLKTLPTADLPALHTIISAGEACSPEIIARWTSQNRRLFNAYGPTEATVWSTIAELTADSKPHIGRAIPNVQLYVLDENLQPVPIGIPGELYIGGSGLARGYLNRPELTAESFISNPFVESTGGRGSRGGTGGTAESINNEQSIMNYEHSALTPNSALSTQHSALYKTGDRVRYLSDGTLEFLGRIDSQVKIRGYRIELGEIEATLTQYPAIQAAAVIIRKAATDHSQLVAYLVVHPETFSLAQLQVYLQERLPTYLIPTVFELLESLPLTPNGKVDVRRLRLATPQNAERTPLAPRTSTEAALTQIWQQVLKREPIHPDDNFFELGGDSLLAMQLIEQIGQQFNQSLPLATLFQSPTIAQFALQLEQPNLNPTTHPCLVPLKRGGKKLPFFCVHPIFGVVFPYCELAYQLDNDQPFYGLQPIGLTRKQPPLTQIEDMAAEYIQAIQSVQPQGPYLIGGWSFGGLVAFEMARQLQQTGNAIALLAIIDSPAPLPEHQPTLCDGLKFLLTTAIGSTLPFLLDYTSLIFSQGSKKKTRFAIASLIPEASRLQLLDEVTLLPILRIFQSNSQAVRRYKAKTYSGKVTLFKTSETSRKTQLDPTIGWTHLAEEVEVISIPGNHLSAIKSPHVLTLAVQLQHCIQSALQ